MVGFASSLRAGYAAASNSHSQTVMVALRDPVPAVELCVVWRADDNRPIVRSFLGCIESARPIDSALRVESVLAQ